jgi:hypothetical protein
MENGEMENREWKFEEMGFPSLPQVSCPVRDIRFAKSDGGITGVLSGIGVESTF